METPEAPVTWGRRVSRPAGGQRYASIQSFALKLTAISSDSHVYNHKYIMRSYGDTVESESDKTKISDSGYINSCSNSQSQRSSGSSKSQNSTWSVFSPRASVSTDIKNEEPPVKRKDKEQKKKKAGSNAVQQLSLDMDQKPLEVVFDRVECTSGEEIEMRPDVPEAIQNVTIKQVCTSIQKLHSSKFSPDCDQIETESQEETKEDVTNTIGDQKEIEELGIAVSMEDGLVVHTSWSLTELLGYPKDMWLGRSLIDFLHPKHRASFAAHITSVIANAGGCHKMYCGYLRKYRGLRSSGFSVTEKWVGYLPFGMDISFKETETGDPRIYLIITASLLRSAYKYGHETREHVVKFRTRHTAAAQVCHVDVEVTSYFGYMPQDMVGRSILEFYHPEDMRFLKEVYEAVMKEQGHLFKSKPYRFRCQNGTYCLLETELSSFVNPWSRKLEFVICQHTLLRGPGNPDVVTPASQPEALQLSDERFKEWKIVQGEIKRLLNETVIRDNETPKQHVTKRCKDLAAFMENLMDELAKPPLGLKLEVTTEQSVSERDSVTLGEISPHHDYYDSKNSIETPPSYNQLNYNDNIQRFFESKPTTIGYSDSIDSRVEGNGCEGEMLSPLTKSCQKSKSGESSGASVEAQSYQGVSNQVIRHSPRTCVKVVSMLTKHILTRHNEDMEKQMVQKHREQRSKSDRDVKLKDRLIKTLEKTQEEPFGGQGMKRSGSHSWEGEPYKAIKASHNLTELNNYGLRSELETGQEHFIGSRRRTAGMIPLYYLPNSRIEFPLLPQQCCDDVSVSYAPNVVHPYVVQDQEVGYSPLPAAPLTGSQLLNTTNSDDSFLSEIETSKEKALPSIRVRRKCELAHHCQDDCKDQKADTNENSAPFDDSGSSFYSLLKTDKSDESIKSSSENYSKQYASGRKNVKRGDRKLRPLKKVAPWVEDINVTPELILKYQLRERSLEEVLLNDLRTLQAINQPELVSEQLSQMYLDLEVEGMSCLTSLEEPDSSSEESTTDRDKHPISDKKYMEYDKMVITFEEDAPLPPPITQRKCSQRNKIVFFHKHKQSAERMSALVYRASSWTDLLTKSALHCLQLWRKTISLKTHLHIN